MKLEQILSTQYKREINKVSKSRQSAGDSKVYANVENRCALSLRLLKTIQFTFHHYAKNLPQYAASMAVDQYPMVISKLLEDNLFSNEAQTLALDAGLLKQNPIPTDQGFKEWGDYTEHYYTFTNMALKLFTGEVTRISDDENKRLNKYITARIGTNHQHVIDSMKKFQFNRLSMADYAGALLDTYRDEAKIIENKVRAKKPTKTRADANQFYCDIYDNSKDEFFKVKKYGHSNGLLYHLFSTCDSNTWAGRIYTPFTAIKSKGRPFLYCTKYPTDKLVELDFATFQVHCLVKAIEELLPNKNVGNLKTDLLTKDFYNELGQGYYKHPKNPIPDDKRKLMKKRTLTALFGKDKDRKTNKTHATMKQAYPEFTARLDELRSKPFREFAKRFNPKSKPIRYKQTSFYGTFYEVQLMKQIWLKLTAKKIPYLTIHDAVLVPEGRAADAIDIMKKEAKKFFGYAPAITDKILERPNLCKPK